MPEDLSLHTNISTFGRRRKRRGGEVEDGELHLWHSSRKFLQRGFMGGLHVRVSGSPAPSSFPPCFSLESYFQRWLWLWTPEDLHLWLQPISWSQRQASVFVFCFSPQHVLHIHFLIAPAVWREQLQCYMHQQEEWKPEYAGVFPPPKLNKLRAAACLFFIWPQILTFTVTLINLNQSNHINSLVCLFVKLLAVITQMLTDLYKNSPEMELEIWEFLLSAPCDITRSNTLCQIFPSLYQTEWETL